MFVIRQQVRVGSIVGLHTFAAVRIIALVTAGGSDEIERTLVGAVGTVLIACTVLVGVNRYDFTLRDSGEDRCTAVGVNRTNHLVSVVVTLQSHVYFAGLHRRQHASTEDRRLFVGGVIRAREEVEVCQRDAVLGVRVLTSLVKEPVANMV